MPDTVQAISRSLSNDVKALDTISHNVANLSTPGFRASRTAPDFRDQLTTLSAIDQKDGPLVQTGRAFDLALRGPGFFVAERGGRAVLVRAGAFRVDGEGMLATANGERIVGAGPIDVAGKTLRVDADGGLWQGDKGVGRLEIVDVADPGRLVTAGNGAYAYDGEIKAWTGSVIQGALEHANIDAAAETVRLMETTRHAEAVQRAISIYDKAMDVGINRLGDN